MAVYTVKQNARYKAELHLVGIEAWASNEMVISRLEDFGFVDVIVKGTGEKRLAEATWPRKTQTGEIPPQIVNIVELPPPEVTIVKVLEAKIGYLKVLLSNDQLQERIGGTVAWRCQNPGNLMNTRFSKSFGSVGEDHIGHAVFPTLADGNKAHYNLLFNRTSVYYTLTLLDALKRYAPESDGNNPYKYQRFITERTGIKADRILKTLNNDERSIMLDYMQHFEGYKEGQVKDQLDGREQDINGREQDGIRVKRKRTKTNKKKTRDNEQNLNETNSDGTDNDSGDFTDHW